MTSAMGDRAQPGIRTASTDQIGGRVVDDRVPVDAAVGGAVELARARPEVDADRLEVVVGHRLAQHADVGVRAGAARRRRGASVSPPSWVRHTAAAPSGM